MHLIAARATVRGFRFLGGVSPLHRNTWHEPADGGACEELELVGIADEREAFVWLWEPGRPWKRLCALWVETYGELPKCCESAIQDELTDDAAEALERDALTSLEADY